jgi:protocatechuate 3,4-dioxygenase beta subunit
MERIVTGMPTLTRRDLLYKCAAAGVLVESAPFGGSFVEALLAAEQAAKAPTPRNELGPFYRRGAPSRAMLSAPGDPGLPLIISGVIYDTRGEIRADASLEIWQADHLGHYDIEGFRYRAKMTPESSGAYHVETVMPGHYPDRVAQHVHYMVKAPGCKPLVTQLYFATDPVFEGDPDRKYMADPLVLSRELVRPVLLTGDPGSPIAKVTFELCLERA